MIESRLKVDDEECGAVEREGGVAGNERLSAVADQSLVADAGVVCHENLCH